MIYHSVLEKTPIDTEIITTSEVSVCHLRYDITTIKFKTQISRLLLAKSSQTTFDIVQESPKFVKVGLVIFMVTV